MIDSVNGEIINIGPEKESTINDLAKIILNAFNSSLKPIYLPDRPREVKEAFCSSAKAERLLGFKEITSLDQGIEKMVSLARSMGYKKQKYIEVLELQSKKTPKTWIEKLI